MKQGIVKWFNSEKGFGFISGDDGIDVFVHYTNIVGEGHKSLIENQRVAYNVVESERGPQAQDVETIEG